MTSRWIVIAFAVALAAFPVTVAQAFGRQVRYAGVHPIRKADGGGICYIDGPHVHIYPANKVEYRVHGNNHVFVGDPVAYGWDGPKHAYKGPHPIHMDMLVGGDPGVEYCYLEGPHYHHFEPPEGPDFKVVGDAYFYVGAPPHAFIEARPAYVGINALYRPIVYRRPVVEVEAPVGWVGARAEFVGPGVVGSQRGMFMAPRPGVYVETEFYAPPPPTVHFGIEVGGPPVMVRERPGAVIVPRGEYEHREHEHREHEHRDHGHGHGKFKGHW